MQRIRITEINYAIRWIVIYPVESAIRRLNNRGLIVNQHNINIRPRGMRSFSLSFSHSTFRRLYRSFHRRDV